MMLIIDKVVTQGAQNTLVALLAGVALLTVFQYLFLWVHAVHAARQAELLAHAQRAAVFETLLASRSGARWVSLGWDVVNACLDRARFRVETRPQFAADCCYVVLLAGLMCGFNLWLALISAAFIPLYLLIDVWGGARARRHMAGCTELRSALAARHFESAAAVEEIRALDLAGYVAARWLDTDVDLAAARYQAALFSRLSALGVEFLQKLSLIVIALVGVGAVIGGTMTLGQYIAFNLLSMQLGAPVLRIAAYRRSRDEQHLAVQAEHALAQNCAADAWAPGGALVLPAQRQTTLHVDSVASVPAAGRSERSVSFAVTAGGWVGITGPSGCGKSTLLRAIAGLEVPRHGTVRINGLAVVQIERRHLARQVRLVGQRPVVFSASVAENIRLGDPTASPQQIAAVARVCGVLEIAERLPGHLNTLVGPAGQTLSGGEMQRIVLARALLAQPRVLLLDEATAALDLPGEAVLLRNARAFLPDAAVVLVAHRQSSLAQCGQIVQMQAAAPLQPVSLAAAG
ncbi:MAG: ATP-binding cassette domain-containing protein [Gammaproteobacteria bacterium]|nr:ATP-binding cassette domain-containing protein [Gammaproteobacteria bacterium]